LGTVIIAPASGMISDTGNDFSHGNFVVISHGFGMTTRYNHLNKVLVRAGQKVNRSDKIAEIGMSGRSTGPHLHYEVRVSGIPVNPMRYILN
jgi:murein DD-endopeptidase MepM/ murein hydrolase activator NlpD